MHHTHRAKRGSLRCWGLVFCVILALALGHSTQSTLAQTDSETLQDNMQRVTVGQTQSEDDVRVEQRLRAAFAEIAALQDITVHVRAGVVELSGTLTSPRHRDAAEHIARKMPAVLYVENLIALAEPPVPMTETQQANALANQDEVIREKLRTVFSHVESLQAIRVEVKGGVVHLVGTTASAEARTQAEELAKKLEGVLFVENDIAETAAVTECLTPSLARMFEHVRSFLVKLPLFLIALGILVVFWLLSCLVGNLQYMYARMAPNKLIQDVLRQVITTLVVLVGVFLALEVIEATALVSAVLGAAGVVGLAVSFTFRDIIENYLASILLSVRQPFKSRDFVQIGAVSGTVIRLTPSETVLMTPEGNHLRLPNATVFKSTITNFSTNPLRRFDFAVGVGVDEDLEHVQQRGLSVLRVMRGVVDEPAPFARVEALGRSSVSIRLFGWINQATADFSKVSSEAIRLVKAQFDAEAIDMPVPIYKVELQRLAHAATDTAHNGDQPAVRRPASPHDIDVSPQNDVQEQIERDIRESAEVDLLQTR